MVSEAGEAGRAIARQCPPPGIDRGRLVCLNLLEMSKMGNEVAAS